MLKIIQSKEDSLRKLLDAKVAMGEFIRLAPGIYTNNFTESQIQDIKNKIEDILVRLNVNGIVMYESAIHFDSNTIWIASTTERKISVGSLQINVIKGNEKELQVDHTEKRNNLRFPDPYLTLLQNHSVRKTDLKRIQPEKATLKFIDFLVEKNRVDNYKQDLTVIAEQMGYLKELPLALKSIEQQFKHNPQCDNQRILMFSKLAQHITAFENQYETVPFNTHDIDKFSFFESYFSNYIEGTIFEVDEALSIVFDPKYKYTRHKDGNDIIKTYETIKNNINQPVDISNHLIFLNTIKQWHKDMFSHRTGEIVVGDFKKFKNKAGNTHFVEPDKVETTLIEAFKLSQQIQSPLGKAIYFKVVLSEVHPFEDGNGRISRVLMNNFLSQDNSMRIIIPTVFRDDYITALKAFSQGHRVEAICSAMQKAYQITAMIPWRESLDTIIDFLQKNSGFSDPKDSLWGIPAKADNTHEAQEQLELFNKKLKF